MSVDPNATPDTALGEFNQNMAQAQTNLLEVRGLVKDGISTAKNVESGLETFARVEKAADKLKDFIDDLKGAMSLISKVSFLKPIAKKLKDALDDMKDALENVRAKAEQIDDDIEASGAKEKAEYAREKLEDYRNDLTDASIKLTEYQLSGLQTECSLDTLQGVAPTTGAALIAAVDGAVTTPNALLQGVNDTYASAKNAVLSLNASVDTSLLSAAANIQSQLDNINSKLAPLAKPLDVLNTFLKPVKWALDAADYIFDRTIGKPLNALLEATGVNALFDLVTDQLKALLPSAGDLGLPDLGGLIPTGSFADIRDGVNAFLESQLGLGAMITDVFDIDGPGGLNATNDLVIGGTDSDVLIGDANNNVISGGEGNDRLEGGAGNDVYIGGTGNDLIIGSGIGDRVMLSGAISEYAFEFVDGSSKIVVSHTKPAAGTMNDGVDTVENVETFVFGNGLELTTTVLEAGIQLSDGSGGPTNPTVMVGVDDPAGEKRDFLLADASNVAMDMSGLKGRDFLLGGKAGDVLYGNNGDDLLDGGDSTGDTLKGGNGFDTASFKSRTNDGAWIDLGADKGESRATGISTNATVKKIEAVVGSELDDVFYGSQDGETLSAQGGDDVLRGFGGDDILAGGAGNDLLIGGTGNDVIDAGDGDDVIVAGEGGSNTYDGGAGFDAVTYAGVPDFVFSNFKQDAEGWVLSGASGGQVDSVGSPAGALQGTDSDGNVFHFIAPAKFLGDQSAMSGGTFAFDIFSNVASDGISGGGNSVLLIGAGISLSIELPNYGPGWTSHVFEFTSQFRDGWRYAGDDSTVPWGTIDGPSATQAQIDMVLANITGLLIRGDIINGTDVVSIDNVLLHSESPTELGIIPPIVSDNMDQATTDWTVLTIDDQAVNAGSEVALAWRDYDGAAGSTSAFRANDFGSNIWYFSAPEDYLGEKDAFYGGSLGFYLKNSSTNDNQIDGDNLLVQGAGLTLRYDFAAPSANNAWTKYQVAMMEGQGWFIGTSNTAATEAQIRAVLADLTGIYIRGEYRYGADTASIDNITLSAPSSYGTNGLLNYAELLIADPLSVENISIEFDAQTMNVEIKDQTGAVVNTDSLVGIEDITGTDNGDVFFTQQDVSDPALYLHGKAGDDIFHIGEGSQQAFGGDGDDVFLLDTSVDLNEDSLQGGDGYDVLDLRGVEDTSWYLRQDYNDGSLAGYYRNSLDFGFESSNSFSTDNEADVLGFEEIHTGAYDDRVFVDAQLLYTYGGDDYVHVNDGFGSKTYLGAGDDYVISFYAEAKEINGGKGNDIFQVLAPQTEYSDAPLVIRGGQGDDLIQMTDGFAELYGGAGSDTLRFGGGYIGLVSEDIIIDLEAGTTGGAVGDFKITSIENLGGGSGNDTIKGDDSSNILAGGVGDDMLYGRGSLETEELAETAGDVLFGNEGNDTLRGGLGDDILHGGAGTDYIVGGLGSDTASWTFKQSRATTADVQIIQSSVGRVDVDLNGSAFAKFTREIAVDRMELEDDHWTLSNPTIGTAVNYTGNDTFSQFIALSTAGATSSGTQAELSRTFDLENKTGEVQLTFSFYEIDDWDNETLTLNIDGQNVFSKAFSNISGGTVEAASSGVWGAGYTWSIEPASASNTDLGFGSDVDNLHFVTVIFDTTLDAVDVEILTNTKATAGIDNVVIGRVNDHEVDILNNIENLIGGDYNDALRGDSGANVLTGGRGDDLLEGNGGADTLLDGEGADTVKGGNGADVLLVGSGGLGPFAQGDDYDGGAGQDLLDYSGLSYGVTLDLIAGIGTKTYDVITVEWTDTGTIEARDFGSVSNPETLSAMDVYHYYNRFDDLPETGVIISDFRNYDLITADLQSVTATDTISGIEDVTGTQAIDTLLGSDEANTLAGGNGADFIKGRKGADTLLGDNGADEIWGGNGADTLAGGRGADTLIGGNGADMFVFAADEGHDSVVDFQDGLDQIKLVGFGLGAGDDILNFATQNGDDVVVDFGSDGSITFQNIVVNDLLGDVVLG